MMGLTLGETSGVITIGKGDAVNVKQIQASEYKDIVMRVNEVAEITPKIVGLADVTEADENTLIQLENIQLKRIIGVYKKGIILEVMQNMIYL